MKFVTDVFKIDYTSKYSYVYIHNVSSIYSVEENQTPSHRSYTELYIRPDYDFVFGEI